MVPQCILESNKSTDMPLSSTIQYMLGTSGIRVEEDPSEGAFSEYETGDGYTPDTLNEVTDIRHLSIFSPTLLSQTIPDKEFMELMLALQKGYKFIDDNGNEKPIRGTRNSNVSSRINDLRAVLTGSSLVSKITPTKVHAICASEVLKLIKDTLITTKVDFRRTFRAETAHKLGYTVSGLDNALDSTVTQVEAPQQQAPQQKSRPRAPEQTGTTTPLNIDTLQTWLQGQFEQQNNNLAEIKQEITGLTEKAAATDAKLLTVGAKADTNEEKITALVSKVDLKERTKGQPELEIELKLKLKAYRNRRNDDLSRGMLKVTVRNTDQYAYRDEKAVTAYNIKPNVDTILKALNIDPKGNPVTNVRNGRAAPNENEDAILPQLILEANHGCLDKNNGTSQTTDHASFLLSGKRDRGNDFYINRAINATDNLAIPLFGKWKQQGFLEKFIVNKFGMITLYVAAEGGHINVRNPLNLATLENPTAERMKAANTHGWIVHRGDPTKAFDTDK